MGNKIVFNKNNDMENGIEIDKNNDRENRFIFDKNNDRIVEINGFKLIVHDNYRPNRRNVICHSNALQLYITLNRLRNDDIKHTIMIGQLINKNKQLMNKNKNTFIDIEVIEVKGYY